MPVFYLYDAANGQYTAIGGTTVPLVSYVGPFDSRDKVVQYLTTMTGYDKGADVPKGYAIIEMHSPLAGWEKIEGPDPFSWLKKGEPFKFDFKLRYPSAATKDKKRKKK